MNIFFIVFEDKFSNKKLLKKNRKRGVAGSKLKKFNFSQALILMLSNRLSFSCCQIGIIVRYNTPLLSNTYFRSTTPLTYSLFFVHSSLCPSHILLLGSLEPNLDFILFSSNLDFILFSSNLDFILFS